MPTSILDNYLSWSNPSWSIRDVFDREFTVTEDKPGHLTLELGEYSKTLPPVQSVRFYGKTTVVRWTDGTVTTVRCSEDETFTRYWGFCAACMKKLFGSNSAIKKYLDEHDTDLLAEKARKEKAEKKAEREAKEREAHERKIRRLARQRMKEDIESEEIQRLVAQMKEDDKR